MPEDTGGGHQRRWIRIARVAFPGTFVPFAHFDCLHNQVASLRNRVLGEVPVPTAKGLIQLREHSRRIFRFLPGIIPMEVMDMPNSYTGGKRARYIQAANDLLDYGLARRDARVKMFVKFEKLNPSKVNPDPRAIQFRHPRYCVALGRFLKPMEKFLYRLKGDGRVLPNSRVIGKGLSQTERAELLVEKLQRFEAPVILSLDATRFDMHVDRELLVIEHSFYKHMCKDPELAQLLSWQLDSQGVTSRGIKYKVRGRRMSGDMNTALGNCILMVLMVSTIMYELRVLYDILDDGDDCLLIVEERDLSTVMPTITPGFLQFGMEIKIESIARSIEQVEWCQSNPVLIDGKYRFIRNPCKVMSTCLGGSKYFTSVGARRKLLNTIGLAELILNRGVPILQEFALAISRNAGTDKIINLQESDPTYYRIGRELRALNLKILQRVDPLPVTDTARLSFEQAFGISVSDQLEYEQFFKGWRFEFDTEEVMFDEIDVSTWMFNTQHSPELYSPRVWQIEDRTKTHAKILP